MSNESLLTLVSEYRHAVINKALEMVKTHFSDSRISSDTYWKLVDSLKEYQNYTGLLVYIDKSAFFDEHEIIIKCKFTNEECEFNYNLELFASSSGINCS